MISRDALVAELYKEGLSYYETKSIADTTESNVIEMGLLSELIAFAKENNIKSVFFRYDRENVDDYLISDENLEEAGIKEKEVRMLLKNPIEQYNKKIIEMDFSRPVILEVFCFFQGFVFAYTETNFWSKKEGIDYPEEKLEEIIYRNQDRINEIKQQRNARYSKKLEDLRQHMLQDKEFHKCTNEYLRMAYAKKLIEKDNELGPALLANGTTMSFVQVVWREYKDSIKKNQD